MRFISPVLFSSTCHGKQTVSVQEHDRRSALTPGYSALDFTLLDPHFGTVQDWIDLIDKMHARGMYIIMDFTVGTMGDMLGFKE